MRFEKPDLNIEILGLNRNDDAGFNYLINGSLPWLQDVMEDGVWERWEVIWRDVRVLDSGNRLRGVLNLTDHDLSVESNRLKLKQMFLDAAKFVDSDKDGLPDDWEMHHFKDLSAQPGKDPDGDGADNATEFAFGTNPVDARSRPLLTWVAPAPRSTVPPKALTFRRHSGGKFDFVIEVSPDLAQWTLPPRGQVTLREPRNYFDGTGALEGSVSVSTGVPALNFFRVRAVAKP